MRAIAPYRPQCSSMTWSAATLLDDLVGADEDLARHLEAERFGGLPADDQLEPGRARSAGPQAWPPSQLR